MYNTYDSIGAYNSKSSPYFDWYKFIDYPDDYHAWWGIKLLPEVNEENEGYRNYICGKNGILRKWLRCGISGWRLDVADELTDDFIEEINRAVKRNKPDGFILGEVWKNPMRMNRGYISSGKGMHSVMNYLLVDALIRYYKYCDVWKLDSILKEILSEYP